MPQAMQLTGVREALHNMRELPRGVQIRQLRIALNAAGGILKRYAAASAPKETGLLKQSIVVKVIIPDASKNTAHHGKPARVIIGPSRKVKRPVHRGAKGLRAITEKRAANLRHQGKAVDKYRKPSRYAHLAHRKTPYLTTAVNIAGAAAMHKASQKLREGVEIERRKLRGT